MATKNVATKVAPRRSAQPKAPFGNCECAKGCPEKWCAGRGPARYTVIRDGKPVNVCSRCTLFGESNAPDTVDHDPEKQARRHLGPVGGRGESDSCRPREVVVRVVSTSPHLYPAPGVDDAWANANRATSEPQLLSCESCPTGICEAFVDDYASDAGVSYKFVNGSSWDTIEGVRRCPDCTVRDGR